MCGGGGKRGGMGGCIYPTNFLFILYLIFFIRENSGSRSQMFFKVGVLRNLAIFTRKHLYWSLFLIKLQAQACNFILKRLQYKESHHTLNTHQIMFLYMCFHTLNNTEPFQHVIYLRTFDERPLTPYHNREIVFGGALLKKKKKKKCKRKYLGMDGRRTCLTHVRYCH